ncbi:DNA-3-methyladenine glycosylase-like [Phoenix dactylifera]|uniref:DNA-3-methyladenine glycosylase-like n=1 Tax=Phoenix dactylifera TaxID=42345 RepID=A0A8B8ZFY2_PHODC|nr:DNA-3-methyladenine glycosylase-like [Phoenix dactylifera]
MVGRVAHGSEPVYVSFHDEEWGVPIHDDRKLFELLVLSEALAEFSWPAILNKRDLLRKLFNDFDPCSVAQFAEKKIPSLKSSGSTLLSEQKMRAVVENARQMLKVIEEFGSFNNYCWSFVNHKPIINGFRYARQVPVKTPKAEAMSKDLMQRGFRCVGPTVIYSFMQAAGIVNDHLSSCFRFEECIGSCSKESRTNTESMTLGKGLTKKCSLQD